MTRKQMKLLLLMLLIAGLSALVVAGKMSQCEAGLPACRSSIVDDFMKAMRQPLIPPEAVAGSIASAHVVIDNLIELLQPVWSAR